MSTVIAGCLGAVAATLVGALAFGSSTLTVWISLMAGCALPMWWLEYKRHRHLPLAASNQSPVARRQRLYGAGLVFLLFVCSTRLQTLLGASQGAYVAAIEFPLLAAVALWAILYAAWANNDRGSVSTLATLAERLSSGKRPTRDMAQCLLGWCIKAFFLPLMVAGSYAWLAGLTWKTSGSGDGRYDVYATAMALLYATDTAFGVIGYISTSHRIGAHIRSVDQTWLGWGSALVCYPPLNAWVIGVWLAYRSADDWRAWFGDMPVVSALWAGAILVLTGIYVWATVVFGPRFSNLTHRGVITSGPFRWSKHPAYISKNLSWWLISVPFLSHASWGEAMRHSAALLGVNAIYALRAWTEQRHLSLDPEYRHYAAWIAMHGMVARMRHRLWDRA